MLYLAIDVHRKQLTVNQRNEEGDVVLRRQVSTRWEKVRKFFDEVRNRSASEGGFVAILEVCGFHDWLVKMLREYGCREIVVIQPEKRAKQKTDRRDANSLCELLWVNRERLIAGKKAQQVRRVTIVDEQAAAHRQLTELWRKTTDARTRVINRVHGLLAKHNLHQECPAKGIQTKRTRRWLEELGLAPIDRLEMDQLLALWKLYDEQLEVLKEKVQKEQKQDENAMLLTSIPGVSAFSSLALSCRVAGGIEQFARGSSLANFWGLTPGCRNSGENNQRLGSITKAGSAMARRILGHLVLHVLRKDAWMRQWYRRIKQRRGSKIARVAVMRRLATIIWNMLKYRQPYCPGGPPRVRQQGEFLASLSRAGSPN
jgi:transposase